MAKKKWAHLVGTLKPLPTSDDPSYDEVRQAFRLTYQDATLNHLLTSIDKLEEQKEALKTQLATVQAELDSATDVLQRKLEDQDLEKVVANGYAYSFNPEPVAQTADAAAVRAWFATHMPELLTVNYQTLNSEVKRALESGDALPDGVEVYMRQKFSRRKA